MESSAPHLSGSFGDVIKDSKGPQKKSVSDLWKEACIDEQSVQVPFKFQRSISAPSSIARETINAENEDIYALRCRVINKMTYERAESILLKEPLTFSPSTSKSKSFRLKAANSFHHTFDPTKGIDAFRSRKLSRSVPSMISNKVHSKSVLSCWRTPAKPPICLPGLYTRKHAYLSNSPTLPLKIALALTRALTPCRPRRSCSTASRWPRCPKHRTKT
jgi:hypothetical protein